MKPLIIAIAAYIIGGTPVGKKTELAAYSQSLPNTVGTMVLHSTIASSAEGILKDMKSSFKKIHYSFIKILLTAAKDSAGMGLKRGPLNSYKIALEAANGYERQMLGLLDSIISRLEKTIVQNEDIESDLKTKLSDALNGLRELRQEFIGYLSKIKIV